MLTDAPVHPSLPAEDLDRASAFYRDKLGLKPIPGEPGHFHCGGGTQLHGLKTVGGIAETPGGRVAWFKDSEGNLLGATQPKG